jgi:hypothetical protein
MKNKLLGCLSATVLGAAIALATPAMAQRGGGGFGGMHGGFGGGGMHFGGGFGGGGMRFGGGGSAGGGFRGGMVTGRSAFVPGGNSVVGAPVARQRFSTNRVNNFPFQHHHHFRTPYLYGYGRAGVGTAGGGRTSAMIMETMATE